MLTSALQNRLKQTQVQTLNALQEWNSSWDFTSVFLYASLEADWGLRCMVWEVCAVGNTAGVQRCGSGVCTSQLTICSRSLDYTQWRIRHVWHKHSKYSFALSNWTVNYHFYVQFKKYHKGHAAAETRCKTNKFLVTSRLCSDTSPRGCPLFHAAA